MSKIEKTFIIMSIIFLTTMIGIFSYRFIYYYTENNKTIETEKDVYNLVLAKKASDSLYKIDNAYFYRGQEADNYIVYSGITWRIIKLENNTLTLISDIPLTNLYFNENYEESEINKYLNNDFYNLLDNRLITDTNTCISNDEEMNCLKNYSNKVVLLSLDIYDKIGGINSYVNNGYYTYLSNTNDLKYYIDDSGKINNTSDNNLYGIKPVITINSADIVNGDGSQNNPYLLDIPVNVLKNAQVGNFVVFSDKIFRITYNDDNSTRLILNDVIEDLEFDGSIYNQNSRIYNYLNNEFYNTLDTSKIINSSWNNGYFDSDLNSIKSSTINCNVGFANLYDLFINDISNHAIMSVSNLGESVYYIKDNSTVYKDILNKYSVRPMINITNNISITGMGTLNNPYVVGDVLNENDN